VRHYYCRLGRVLTSKLRQCVNKPLQTAAGILFLERHS
jgi:hypothetical protein